MPIGSCRSGDLSEDSAGDVGSCYVHPRKNLEFLAFAGMAFLRGWLMSKLGARGWTMRLKTFRQEFLFIPALIKSKARQVEFHVSDRDSKWWSEFDSLIP